MWKRTLLSLACALPALLLPARTVLARIEIVGADELRERIEVRDGVATLSIDGTRWELVTDPRAPFLSTLGDGAFHPMDRHEVEAAVSALKSAERLPDLSIYVLPFPRREVLKSSCRGSTVFLSPGVREVPREHVHMTVAHEIGHVFQHVRVPEGTPSWNAYVQLRGLNDVRFRPDAEHRNRPAEIFAEDFRMLMGGALAASAGPIENSDLPAPQVVPGLPVWFRHAGRTIREEASPLEHPPVPFPNPFRVTAVGGLQVRFAGAGAGPTTGQAEVFDLEGRRVRALPEATRDGDDMIFRWDGRDRTGRTVATGTYFVRWQRRPDLGTARVQVLH
jgi:hypothetical protein